MSGLPVPSASADVWPRNIGSTSTGPIALGGGPTGSPFGNNSNSPAYTPMGVGNLPPPIPQAPTTHFPSSRPQLGPANSLVSNNYATATTSPSTNPMPMNFVCILLKRKR